MEERPREGCTTTGASPRVGEQERRTHFDFTTPPPGPGPSSREVKAATTFRLHNLLEPLKEEPFDCVFIKNVLIYFDAESKRTVVQHLLAALAKGATWWSALRRASTACSGVDQTPVLALPEAGLTQNERGERPMSGFDHGWT